MSRSIFASSTREFARLANFIYSDLIRFAACRFASIILIKDQTWCTSCACFDRTSASEAVVITICTKPRWSVIDLSALFTDWSASELLSIKFHMWKAWSAISSRHRASFTTWITRGTVFVSGWYGYLIWTCFLTWILIEKREQSVWWGITRSTSRGSKLASLTIINASGTLI